MKILLVHGVGHAERPDNQPWKEAITAGIQYFDHGLTPTYEHFDYDDLFSGKVNLLTDPGIRSDVIAVVGDHATHAA